MGGGGLNTMSERWVFPSASKPILRIFVVDGTTRILIFALYQVKTQAWAVSAILFMGFSDWPVWRIEQARNDSG